MPPAIAPQLVPSRNDGRGWLATRRKKLVPLRCCLSASDQGSRFGPSMTATGHTTNMRAPEGRDNTQLLTEDEVSLAVRSHLEKAGWTITSWALAAGRIHGDDIVAELEGRQLIIEVKGEGSSDPESRRFGLAFNSSQVTTHVAMATYKALQAVSKGAEAGIALPDNLLHRRTVRTIQPALSDLGISVFWVDGHSAVAVS